MRIKDKGGPHGTSRALEKHSVTETNREENLVLKAGKHARSVKRRGRDPDLRM